MQPAHVRLHEISERYHCIIRTHCNAVPESCADRVLPRGVVRAVKSVCTATSLVFMRVAREHLTMLWSTLAMMNSIKGVPAALRVLACKGTHLLL